jgi:hypothetical protein
MDNNAFIEIEKGVKDWQLPSTHPYWSNYVKVRRIRELFIMKSKYEAVKHDLRLFQMEFSKNKTPERVEYEIEKGFKSCYGAYNHINHKLKLPSRQLIIN